MVTARVNYLRQQILNHVSSFFLPAAREALQSDVIEFLPYTEAVAERRKVVAIPIDIPTSTDPKHSWRVDFNGTTLNLWGRTDRPSQPDWTAIPGDSNPLWYQHKSGTVLPAWNTFGVLFDLLTFAEERNDPRRDEHGRFAARFSPRQAAGLLEVPAFNEAVAALVAAAVGLQRDGTVQFHLDGLLKPPVAVLSHDCDILLGNDKWTQLVRGFRVFQPLMKARLPRVSNLWWMARNAVFPRRFYFDNVTGMIDLERIFDFNSTFYLLNGSAGRYGARSGTQILPEIVQAAGESRDVGIHYNYDTFLDYDRFGRQLDELAHIVGRKITVGRAHYLRFAPEKSLPFLESFGIRCDESAGYADRIGYRCGIGGCFQAYDFASERALDICEVPIVVMDATLQSQYPDEPWEAFGRLIEHLSRVGGALSLIFHPGQFHNPEFPWMLGLYHRILLECRRRGAVSQTALFLAEATLRGGRS